MATRALLVGLNHYPDPANELRGCINDVRQTSKMLQQEYGFDATRGIRLLTDARATTGAIVKELRWLLDGSAAGDVLVFHYSGHGAQVRDREGDESDGLDEIICPYDLDWDSPFTDDDLYEIVKDVTPGVNLTVILDCCHSGTGLRKPVAGRAPVRPKYLSAPPDVSRRVSPIGQAARERGRGSMRQPKADLAVRRFGARAAAVGAVLIAGCRADQVSADAWIDGEYHGALTYYLWKAAAEAGFKTTYTELARRARKLLAANDYDQIPQLEGPSGLLDQAAFAPFQAVPQPDSYGVSIS
jgi:metacaspase-1